MSEPDERVPGADVREVKRGRFTVSRLHRRGVSPYRVLIMGSQTALGSGRARRQAEAMSDLLADRLWLRSRRGVDLDVLWELRPVLKAVRGGFGQWRLWRYDAVVVVAATPPIGLPARLRMIGVGRLLRSVVRDVAAASHLLVVSVEGGSRTGRRSAGAAAPRFAAGLRVRRESSALVDAITVSDDPAASADRIAARLADVLADPAAPAPQQRADRPDDEEGRQRTVDALSVSPQQVRHLERVAMMARNSFGVEFAEIDVIRGDRQHTVAAAGAVPEDVPRNRSLCARAIERPGLTVIPDTLRVLAPDRVPSVEGRPIRFYAAYPIESVEGYRVGALCVFDTAALPDARIDGEALRDLALLAEAEMLRA